MSDSNLYLYSDSHDQSIPLKEGDFFCGRTKGNHIIIPEASISGRHFRIKVKGNTATIVDMNSHNKTLLNSVPLEPLKEYTLKEGDTIRAGDLYFGFCTKDLDFDQESKLPDSTGSLNLISALDASGHESTRKDEAPKTNLVELFEQAEEAASKVIIPGKKQGKLSDLRDAKARVTEIENQIATIQNSVNEREKLEGKITEAQESFLAINRQMADSPYQKMDEFIHAEKDIIKKIEKFEEEIASSQEKIKELEKQIFCLKDEIKKQNEVSTKLSSYRELCQQRVEAENRLKAEKTTLDNLNSLKLEDRIEELKVDLEMAKEDYKDVQEQYGASRSPLQKRKKNAA